MSTDQPQKRIIIHGVTDGGDVFRPSDWAERMSGKLSTFTKHRIRYSPMLQPCVRGGAKCVILDPKLESTNPALFASILQFARNNKLQITEDSV
jgi:hypothetical protein